MTNIHPTAVVHPKAKIGRGVRIGAYTILQSPEICLDENVTIEPHVFIDGNVHIKRGTTISPFVSIGAPPQNLAFRGEKTSIIIGEDCQIREYVSINAPCGEGEVLVIGDGCFIMAYCHIAHNCTVGNHVIMANGATLGGHVVVGDHANLGGMCAIHQNCRIGDYAMVGGGSMLGTDVPPFTMGSGYPMKLGGLNWVGMKRKGIPHEIRKSLIQAYRTTFLMGLSWHEAREHILKVQEINPYLQRWIEFCDQSRRGLTPVKEKRVQAARGERNYPELVEMG